jgi:hypothetical protein
MRALVQRDPESEVARPERVPLLEREHVDAHVVDGVVDRAVVVIRWNEQVVLAEHPLREPAEEHAELRGRHRASDRGERAAGDALADPLGEWSEEVAHRTDVGVDPTGAVEHEGARRGSARAGR